MPAKPAATLLLPAFLVSILIASNARCATPTSTSSAYLPVAEPQLKEAQGQPDSWFASDEGVRFCRNVAGWQNENGGWWKQYDAKVSRPREVPAANPHDGPAGDNEGAWRSSSTIDNGATYSEIRLLARAERLKPAADVRKAVERGLDFLLTAQYLNGGWPQRFPLQNNYGRHITFNDNAMANVLRLLDDVARGEGDFAFIDAGLREKAKAAFDRGIGCILDCHYRRDGELTAWCQQHDEVTLAPTSARAYELPALTANESGDLLAVLMKLPNPDPRVRQSIDAVARWLDQSKITGKRWTEVKGAQFEQGRDKVLVDDPEAPPIWSRFYDLQTNKPFFVDRDGVKRDDVAQISNERRVKYAWYGTWPASALKSYATWKKNAVPSSKTPPASIQSAIDALPLDGQSHVVNLPPGVYRERVRVPADRSKLTLRGGDADASKTVITFDLNANSTIAPSTQPVGTGGSSTFVVEAADFTAENITFENSAGDRGQAVAAKLLGDRAIFRNCRFLGWQDTLYTDTGRHYFVDCYIEGRVDFIFGGSTAVFDRCTIHSKNGGYVTAARTLPSQRFGFVFLDCKLTGEGVEAYLGRPWQWDRGRTAAVAFVRTRMGPHIRAEGWNRWDRPNNPNTQPSRTCRYSEFQSTDFDGRAVDVSKRVEWSRQLTADEAAELNVRHVLGGDDGWDPTRAATH